MDGLRRFLAALRELFTGRYVRMLEEECARLREREQRRETENRALLNTLLGRMGFEPVESAASPPGPPQIRRSGLSRHQMQLKTERESWAKLMDRGRPAQAQEEPEQAKGGD